MVGVEDRVRSRSPCRGSLAENQVTNCDQFVEVEEVPVLDLEDWHSGSAERRKKITEDMRFACEKAGFFFVRNHRVPQSTIDNAFDCSKRYFDLSKEEKEKIPMSKDYPYGYECAEVLVRSEEGKHGDHQQKNDLKETFTMCLGPKERKHSTLKEPRWPENPSDYKAAITEYYREVEQVSEVLVRIAALALEVPEDFFIDNMKEHVAALRTLNYPDTQGAPPSPGQLRASPHTDYGLFTILAAGANPEGLQLMKADGGWLDVTIPADCFTVNIGDMFCRWTNDKWRSTRHRVVVPPGDKGNRRQSIAFFLNPTPDVTLTTLGSCVTEATPDKYRSVPAGEYLMMKHFFAMGYSK
jgi:isopenicillin N synthase-like dioxygenase|mmetsp:Transcript_56509/g.89742  ORF Transcript_56509/g.89742 Transcript_56509/m.89742 type:complete len:354 (+) Transcript_56509:80-1141(+)|eukprot:CAMPEP_0169124898 /NCGR_PEP_ID=MMETSP1015-20121227/34581_1 /TAXON_ID=342587 /ORGANISM="Karlodinium micrum, Strain CCMP2283" /LENGTH=353 /DNA_ID=CAMNT_0009188367 /DNA_START=69 /DNA_END=1130 /DNA_ORIENTATION=-